MEMICLPKDGDLEFCLECKWPILVIIPRPYQELEERGVIVISGVSDGLRIMHI
jgi:hypothetical protein